jgi:outer membrane immunogenic protein
MKMKFSALTVAAALVAGSATAADLPSRKEAPVFVPPPVFSWTGPYLGLNLGGSWLTRNNNDWNNWGGGGWGWNNNSGSNGGVSGGLQLGYNYQLSPMFVVGLETDFQGTSIGGSNNNNNNWWGAGNGWGNLLNDRERVPWFGTVRGRLGVALLDSRLLIYGTGGFGYGEVNRNNLLSWWGNNNNGNIRTGWTAGGGVEWAFLPNWSAKIEYLYTELSDNNNNNNNWWIATLPAFQTPGVVGVGAWNWTRHRTQINTVRAGVNYHFNLFTPAPVIARY